LLAVVTVRPADAPGAARFDPQSPLESTGVVIDPGRGLVLTVDRPIANALDTVGSIVVELPDGRIRPVLDVRRDPKSDLALLSIDPSGASLRGIPWGDSSGLEPGDEVLAVGRSTLLGGTVSAGVVAGTRRTLSGGPHRDLILTDASLPDPRTGGALIDLSGHLVGLVIPAPPPSLDATGFRLAVPSHRARRIAEDLAQIGRVRRSAIGVRIGTADPEQSALLDPPGAVRVEAVTPEGSASRSGLRAGDLILSVGGRPVATPEQLASAIEFAPTGEPIPIDILRDGLRTTLNPLPDLLDPIGHDIGPIASATPSDGQDSPGPTSGRPEPPPNPIRLPDPPSSRDPSRFPTLGLRLGPPSPELAERFGLDPHVPGLVIVGIVPGGPADLGGLSPGMVVTDVMDRRVGSLADFREAVALAPLEGDLILRILNRGRAEFRVILRKTDAPAGDRSAEGPP
jgi:serine protease Do